MGFLGKVISATVKTALTPVAVVKDVIDVASGEEAENTKKILESAGDDLEEAGDDLADGNIIGE